MSDIITVRDGDIIAAEINTIKEDTRRIMIANAIRIGGKLVEAKATVPFGEWGKWLEEKVDYSQSTANNLMKLYQEYGTGEVNLFDNWTNSQTFANLSYSQHMAMLALPFADRAEFAERNHVEEMSTRELEKAVREELEKTQKALEMSEQLRNEEQKERETLQKAVHQATRRAQEAEAEISGHAKTADAALRDKKRAEDSEKNALGLVKKLETQLLTAQEAEKVAREELKKAMENPTVPDDLMAKLRKEAETEAAKAAADKARKDTDKLRKELEAAKAEAEAAAKARAAAEGKLADAEKQAKLSDPEIIAYQTLAEQLMQSYNVLNGYRLKVVANNPDAGERLKKFQTAMLSQWIDALQKA